jgi:thiol-disulfide isomerase/thioredoxin
MKVITAILLFIFIWNVTFSQTELSKNDKVRVYIEYSTGKMHSQNDVEGNVNSWLGSLSKAPFKRSNDTIYFYLIEDVEEYLRMTKKNSMAIVGEAVNLQEIVELSGNKYSLENLIDKVIVLNFWFTSCRPCVAELPELNKLSQEYNDKDVVFLAPTFNTDDEVNSFLSHKEFHYTILPNARQLISDYRVSGYPTHIIIDRNSVIRFYQIGAESESIFSILNTEIEKLL